MKTTLLKGSLCARRLKFIATNWRSVWALGDLAEVSRLFLAVEAKGEEECNGKE